MMNVSACVTALLASTLLFAAPQESSPSSLPATWSDGVLAYEDVRPVAGWVLPLEVHRLGYKASPTDLVKHGRKVDGFELVEYATGLGGLKEVPGFLLLKYPPNPAGMLHWKGARCHRQQQVLPRIWNGELWETEGRNFGDADEIEFEFHGRDRGSVFVFLDWQCGARDCVTLKTEFMRLGGFPGTKFLLERALAAASVVVHAPKPLDRIPEHGLDCLKGTIRTSELVALGATNSRAPEATLFFLRDDGGRRTLWFSFGHETLTIGDRVVWLRPSIDARTFRWELAQPLRGDPPRTRRIELVTTGDWVVLQIAVGWAHPGWLYSEPMKRHQRDGGEPRFAFHVRKGDVEVAVAPRGRFGDGSLYREAPEVSEALDCEYRFIDCGPGIIKLAIRPRTRPWAAEIGAKWVESVEWRSPLFDVVASPVPVRVE